MPSPTNLEEPRLVGARHVAFKWSHEGKFVFQGRTYDMKVRDDGQGAVVYQKSPKCLFARDGDGWIMQAGSKALFDAAMNHLKQHKISADPDSLRLQEGPGFHLQPDGTWAVGPVPPVVARDARFSGFLAIEGYWCAVFELGGEEWAQKAAGEAPVDSPMAKLSAIGGRHMRRLSRIAFRVAGLRPEVPAQRVVDRLYDSPYEWAWKAAKHVERSGMSEADAIQYLYDEPYEAAWTLANELEHGSEQLG